jgi:uncharacterized phage protein gp47/JayE
MPFARPSLTALRNQSIQDITTSGVPGLTGLLRNAVLRVLAWVMSGLAYSLYGYGDWIARMGVPFTAQDEYLFAWAALIGVYPEQATASSGPASFTGNPPTSGPPPLLPSGSPLLRQDGTPFVTTADAVVDSGGNLTVPITATVLGAFTNCAPGTPITISPPVAGINAAGVTGLCDGGADQETNDALRTRMLLKYRNPPQGGANSDYIEWALEVPGCTRAWAVGSGYGAGTVVVYTMWDIVEAAFGGFPQGTDGVAADETRDAPATGDQLLVANYIFPLQPVTALVYSVAPLPYPIDVTLVGLEPNTVDIQDGIVAALNDLFLVIGEVGGVIWPSDINEAILATPGIAHFTLSAPAAAIQAPAGNLPILGTFTAPPLPT